MALFREWLESGRTILLDGGMGSQLIARGLQAGERWNLERPDVILAIHRDYREAGAEVLLTNTLGANRLAMARHGSSEAVEALNRAGAELARRAAGDGAVVAGNLGPTGQFLEPLGDLTPEQLLAAFREQAAVLAAAQVDLFVIETMADPEEMALAVRACREVSDLPVATGAAFDPGASGYRTMMGKTPEECARAAAEAGADVVGANCGAISSEQMAEVAAEMRRAVARPVLCEANAGRPGLVGVEVRYERSLEEWLRGMLACRAAGAQLLGGCCGTTPEHIRALAQAIGGTR